MAYPTLPEIKARLGVTDALQDVRLTHALAVARSAVESYCGYRWGHTTAEMRLFKRQSNYGAVSRYNVSDPGLISWTSAVGITRNERSEIPADRVVLERFGPAGAGAFDLFRVNGRYEFMEIVGVWGQGLAPPDEVSEAVMHVAMSVFVEGGGLSYSDAEVTKVNAGDFDDGLIGFLLSGHRRYR